MKIKLLEWVAIKGQPTKPGTVVDLTPAECASLIRRKMGEHAEDGPAPVDGTFLAATADAPQESKRRRK